MLRFTRLPLLVLAASLACGCPGGENPRTPVQKGFGDRPSVLLLTLDTTRRDRLGVYGSTLGLTPTLDALAAEGVAFMDARTEVPITLPSHASMHTGQGLREHGIRENGSFRLGEETRTLAEELRKSGYATGAFVSTFVLDAQFGLAQGFDEYDAEMTSLPRPDWQGHDVAHFERQGNETADRALAWLDRQGGARPFFAWVHFYDPHAPYRPPAEHRRPGRSAYDAEVAFMDAQVARVLEKARAVDPDLLVVVASDHGENLGEHSRGHGHDLWEPAMRAVLLMTHPDQLPAGGQRPARVTLASVGPTILELVGLPPRLGERSVAALARGETQAGDSAPLYMETLVPKLRAQRSAVHGVLVGSDKLIAWPDDHREMLFDLTRDPLEQVDLLGRRPARAAELRALLADLLPGAGGGAQGGEPAGQAVPMDARTIEALRALGYAGAEGLPPGGAEGDAQEHPGPDEEEEGAPEDTP